MDWPIELLEGDLTPLVQAIVDMLRWVLLGQVAVLSLALALLSERPAVVRRFWCALQARNVEVVFVRTALPLFGAPLTVRCCSAFDSPDAITCDRRCAKAECRLPTQPLLLSIARP